METIRHKKLYTHGMILLTAVGVLVYTGLFSLTYFLFQPRISRSHVCADFGSYADILKDFRAGNRGLDGDGDGIPCENRK